MSIFMGFKTEINNCETIYYDEFYSILNDLIRMRLIGVSVIKSETMPVFKKWRGSNPGKPISEFNVNPCIAQIKRKNLDSIDAKYMYNTIDSTRVFKLDPEKVIISVITEIKFEEIFRNDDSLMDGFKILRADYNHNKLKEAYNKLEKTYGSGCFISVSTPIFNSSYTKAILFINYCCEPNTRGRNSCGSQLILEKEKGKWRLIDDDLRWINGLGY